MKEKWHFDQNEEEVLSPRLELGTSSMLGWRSNQLSYESDRLEPAYLLAERIAA